MCGHIDHILPREEVLEAEQQTQQYSRRDCSEGRNLCLAAVGETVVRGRPHECLTTAEETVVRGRPSECLAAAGETVVRGRPCECLTAAGLCSMANPPSKRSLSVLEGPPCSSAKYFTFTPFQQLYIAATISSSAHCSCIIGTDKNSVCG